MGMYLSHKARLYFKMRPLTRRRKNMRLRHKPWARPELEACQYFIDNPKELKNKWRSCFKNNNPVHLYLDF